MSREYRLADGTMGTEAEALAEAIRVLEMQKLQLDGQIAALKRQLQTAAGRA
jgi:hypothetical protein